ncbi:MAG: carboxylate-amine ligase [Notoacmeibacter sp.]|nr:carboxylate-amine ligase [Notoacmeibacter sp.]MCC0032143.1 carboxylate-amine ligase [Brucellaceae bacterium]
MAVAEPAFTMGIEEEYLLVDRGSLELAPANEMLMEECRAALAGQVSPEFLQCQIEVGTRVCRTAAEARDDLRRLRLTIAEVADRHGLAPLAVSCHPFADWHSQHHTDKDRYNGLERDLGSVARRMLICGMHVHVGIADDDMRNDLMGQFCYFLPHLLALSASSPFWQGEDTGLASWRLTVFDNLPRTGLPPVFPSHEAYRRAVDLLVANGIIEDGTKIWWDARPSDRFPTLEARICDVSPVLDDGIAIAALVQCILRMLYRLRRLNQRWRVYDHFLLKENRWRAQRYGVTGGLIDLGRGEIVPFGALLQELLQLVAEDAEALGCTAELERHASIVADAGSAGRQRAVWNAALAAGEDAGSAGRRVVQHLMEAFTDGL